MIQKINIYAPENVVWSNMYTNNKEKFNVKTLAMFWPTKTLLCYCGQRQ